MTHRVRALGALLLFALPLFGMGPMACGRSGDSDDGGVATAPQAFAYVPNSFAFWNNRANWPTPYGPAYADVLVASTQFLPCIGGPIALCYYSGPNPQPCVPTSNGRFSNCTCFEIPYGPYFVLETAILNHFVYEETVAACGADGSACTTPNSAPVCDVINQNRLIPGADLISTFSLACVPTEGLGLTSCAPAAYAGCMTAPCTRTSQEGIVSCQCPNWTGPFQIGETGAQCTLPAPLVYSAAYNPAATGTVPTPPSCVPDAPGSLGCPLLDATTELPPGTDCNAVCREYASCRNSERVETGYTCDATLCTAGCNDQDLVEEACSGLSGCNLGAIIALESAAGCSCCASQLCGCRANPVTNRVVRELDRLQAARGIQSQCAINGTLCGR